MIRWRRTSLRKVNRKGFTLLEVMIAIFVATIGILSLSLMQTSAIKGNCAGNEGTMATFLAQDMLERIKGGDFVDSELFGFIETVDEGPGAILISDGLNGIDASGGTDGPFDVKWQIATNTNWSRRIAVTVSWKSILGSTRYVNFVSISRGDQQQ
jgi:type IV pilus assembly protein PilV